MGICIHVNVCHVYIVCHAYIYKCVYLVRFDLDIILHVVSDGDDSAKGWRFLFENVGVFEVHELHEEFLVHSEHPGRRVLGRKMICWREKNCYFEPKGVHLYPPKGVTMRRGREWKLLERNDSRNHSRKYSRELWEVTSLSFSERTGLGPVRKSYH